MLLHRRQLASLKALLHTQHELQNVRLHVDLSALSLSTIHISALLLTTSSPRALRVHQLFQRVDTQVNVIFGDLYVHIARV